LDENENVVSRNTASEAESQLARTILRLREMVLKGEFGPGERISEAPLTGRIGVSRTPIRLALERLAHEGLLEPYPTGGFIVRKFTLDHVWDSIEVRGLLEGGAARMAAERLRDESELDTLRNLQHTMDALGQPTPASFSLYLERNHAFHTEVVRLAKSEMIKTALERLFSMPLASPRALVSLDAKLREASELFIISREHHLRLIEAISQRQGARAEYIAREHAQVSRRNLEIALADVDVFSSLPGGALIQM
jgi:GntR family transcriptional regulator of vanillate catabolism